jgi:hypothetical protein
VPGAQMRVWIDIHHPLANALDHVWSPSAIRAGESLSHCAGTGSPSPAAAGGVCRATSSCGWFPGAAYHSIRSRSQSIAPGCSSSLFQSAVAGDGSTPGGMADKGVQSGSKKGMSRAVAPWRGRTDSNSITAGTARPRFTAWFASRSKALPVWDWGSRGAGEGIAKARCHQDTCSGFTSSLRKSGQ